MKKNTLSLLACALTGGLFAQDSGFSLGVDLAFPTGDFGKATTFA